MLGHMANLPTNGVNGHLPGDALAAGRLPGKSLKRIRVLRHHRGTDKNALVKVTLSTLAVSYILI